MFGTGFSWIEAFDALADIYNGVRSLHPHNTISRLTLKVCFLVDANLTWASRMV